MRFDVDQRVIKTHTHKKRTCKPCACSWAMTEALTTRISEPAGTFCWACSIFWSEYILRMGGNNNTLIGDEQGPIFFTFSILLLCIFFCFYLFEGVVFDSIRLSLNSVDGRKSICYLCWLLRLCARNALIRLQIYREREREKSGYDIWTFHDGIIKFTIFPQECKNLARSISTLRSHKTRTPKLQPASFRLQIELSLPLSLFLSLSRSLGLSEMCAKQTNTAPLLLLTPRTTLDATHK